MRVHSIAESTDRTTSRKNLIRSVPCNQLRGIGTHTKVAQFPAAIDTRFAWDLSCRGSPCFPEWMTSMASEVEEHTLTQNVLALQRNAAATAKSASINSNTRRS